MSEFLDINSISIVYNGDVLVQAPNTYKAFLESLRNKEGISNKELAKRTIWCGDFPILNRNDYIEQLKKKGQAGRLEINIIKNEEGEDNLFGDTDYKQYLEMTEPEEEIKIKLVKEEPKIVEEEKKEETIFIKSDVNEFYAITQVTQYYKNNNNKPVELNIIYPLKKEINFRKFTVNVNGKKSVSKIFPKEKAEEKYNDAIAGGNIGILSKYAEEEPNSYSIAIGNVEPNSTVELTSEFIQFITSDDMSFCFSVMTNYPTFSDSVSEELSKNINGQICLKTHSKITRLVNKNFTLDNNFKQEFNPEYTECNIEFKIINNYKQYNAVLNILYRTEKMDEPYLLSQYDPKKDETSYIFGKIYESKPIPIPETPDTNIETNYYLKYEQPEEKANTPSLFIFLIDQSGSMSGSAIKIVSEALLFFLQSLTKGCYFQLIGFGSNYKKINYKPVEYTKENLKETIDIVKNLRADLGGTDISSPLKEIFNSKDYDGINLARNLFILTDGEVDDREECLELISTNSEKFKVHAIGIGSSFDKQLIQNAGMQGKGSYHFVSNVSDVNSVIIESLSKCLRNYILNAKFSLNEIKPEQEFIPKMNIIYPDEILNYYFILKGKEHDKIQINFENHKKNENFIFTTEKIIQETDGDIIGQIIVGNKLKNEENMEEDIIVKLSKEYQILSKKTSLFAVAENEENNKIAEFKQISKKKKKESYYNFSSNPFNIQNNFINNNNSIHSSYHNIINTNMNNNQFSPFRQLNQPYQSKQFNQLNQNIDYYGMNRNMGYNQIMSNQNISNQLNQNIDYYGINRNMGYNQIMSNQNIDISYNNMYPNRYNNQLNNFNNNNFMNSPNINMSPNFIPNIAYGSSLPNQMMNSIRRLNIDEQNYSPHLNYNSSLNHADYLSGDQISEPHSQFNSYSNDIRREEKKVSMRNDESSSLKFEKEEEKKVEFSNKELVLTQDIYEGFWNLNPQTKLLIEKEKNIYDKIEQIMKEKNIEKEEIKITLLVLYYLNTNTSINKVEYMLIIKKGMAYLEQNKIIFDEILNKLNN